MQKETEEKLRDFIARETWYTNNSTDVEKFYQFTVAAYRNGDTNIDFSDFFRIIKEIQKNSKNFEDEAGKYYSKYSDAMDAFRVFNTGKI